MSAYTSAVFKLSSNAERHGTVLIGLMACMNEVRTNIYSEYIGYVVLCFCYLLPGIPGSLLLVAAGCSHCHREFAARVTLSEYPELTRKIPL